MTIRSTKPNIIYFFVDDMGYGDASCLNPDGKIQTPNIDRLAQEGMVFTDAHSSSAVCSPSRYSVLTGRYNWRSRLQQGIVGKYGDPLIAEDRLTVPALLKQHGYHTGCIGKWHLGQGWDFAADQENFHPGGFQRHRDTTQDADTDRQASPQQRAHWQEAFSKPTTGGPTTRGFDYYFGVDVPNWPPYCFIENDRTVGIPSELLPSRLIGDNLASFSGPAMPYWHFEQLLPTWAQKADSYIGERAAADEPFFLYLPMTSPHTPLSVNKPWIGKSGLNNLYADLMMETDDVFGRVLTALERHGVAHNTLVVFASDNGCAHYIGADALEAQGHFPSGPYRGYKSDAWDGGHRIPCIARWPGVIGSGSQCGELVCLSDLMATCAEIVGDTLPDSAGEDSFSMLPLFCNAGATQRNSVVHHSITGKFAIRADRWKLVLCPGSGGWTKNDAEAADEGLPLVQLYDIQADPGEKHNLHVEHPNKVKELLALLKRGVADGRSTPGEPQQNDVPVDIWKLETMPTVDARMLDDY
jgi:arylsulfatase A